MPNQMIIKKESFTKYQLKKATTIRRNKTIMKTLVDTVLNINTIFNLVKSFLVIIESIVTSSAPSTSLYSNMGYYTSGNALVVSGFSDTIPSHSVNIFVLI